MPLTLSPGDWKAFGEGSRAAIRAVIGTDQHTQWLADVGTGGMTGPDDAKVMAASKDLYLAAREVLAAAEMFAGEMPVVLDSPLRMLRAAVTKAEAQA